MGHIAHPVVNTLVKGRYVASVATRTKDIREIKALRGLCFGLKDTDEDGFDLECTHIAVRHRDDDRLVACFRMQSFDGATITSSYSAQFYDLSALTDFKGTMVELGRFCIHPQENDPDILRLAWAVLTSYVDQRDVKLLFGCSSFTGTDPAQFNDAFAILRDRHLAPTNWAPKPKAPDLFKFAQALDHKPDIKQAMRQMPNLLRTYLLMGGWVSDHAVFDHTLNTTHVFTGVEIDAIPAARKRLLRADVG